jgi:hypothetical protein
MENVLHVLSAFHAENSTKSEGPVMYAKKANSHDYIPVARIRVHANHK